MSRRCFRLCSLVGTVEVIGPGESGQVRFFSPPDPPENVPAYQIVLTTAEGEQRVLSDVVLAPWASFRIPDHLPGAPGGKLMLIGTRVQVQAQCALAVPEGASAVVTSTHPNLQGGPCELIVQPEPEGRRFVTDPAQWPAADSLPAPVV